MKTKLPNKNFPDQRSGPRRKRFAFPLLLILATVVLISACGLPSLAVAPVTQPASTSVSPSQAVAPTAPPTGNSVLPGDALAAIIQAMKAQLKAMPYRVTMTNDSGKGTPFKSTVEFESLQRFLVITSSGSYKVVDGKIYQETNGIWQEYPAGASIIAGFQSMGDQASVDAFIASIKSANLVNTETINGQTTRHYEFTYADPGTTSGVPSQGTVQLWVTEAQGLPIKEVIEAEAAGYKSTATSIIEYDPTIRVTAP